MLYVTLARHVDAPLLMLDRKVFNIVKTSEYDFQLLNEFSIPSLSKE